MEKSWMKLHDKFSKVYRDGVDASIAFPYQNNGGSDMILCPCPHCANISHRTTKLVRTHLILYGMKPSYTKWICHGEQVNNDEDQVNEPHEDEVKYDHFDGFDAIQDLLGDIYRANTSVE
uniref:Transposase-associated domain-containing protein n=1 Tax=Arundo donax TaxID=35708 RepID=A0A0A9DCX7_ARUDO